MLNQISEARRSMLQAAASREDRLLQPPANASGAAAKNIARKLIDAGWAKEIKAPKGAPIWRRDAAGAGAYTLKLTAKALKAVATSTEESADGAKALVAVAVEKVRPKTPSQQTEKGTAGKTARSGEGSGDDTTATAARTPRTGSKLDRVLVMLSSEAGATIGDLMTATGWLEHSTRAALTGLRRRGYEVCLARGERRGASVYRIAGRGDEAAK